LRDNLNHKFYESHFNDAWVSRREIDKEIFNQSVNLSFWEKEEEVLYDSTVYEFHLFIRGLVREVFFSVEVLQNDGNYVYIGSGVSGDNMVTPLIRVSNVAFKDGYPIVRVTGFDFTPYYNADGQYMQHMLTYNGEYVGWIVAWIVLNP
jgi:hypothetical protein